MKTLIVTLLIAGLLFSQTAFADTPASNTQNDNIDYLKSVMDMVKDKYKGDVTDKQLVEGALKGMFGTMDQYTVYYNPEEAKGFFNQIDGTFQGIGIMMNKMGDYVTVQKVFSSSPADRAGIRPGDKIAVVDGKNVVGTSIDLIASMVRGNVGTKVTLGIIKSGGSSITSIEIVREQIKINPVTYEIKNDIGYIKLDVFNANSEEYMNKAFDEMDKNKISKIILDLRNNPGGEVDQAVAIARKLIPAGLITKLVFKSKNMPDEPYYSYMQVPKYTKIMVLVNEMSASASEILAGAIQDTKVGTLIGTKTFGKGVVQNVMPLLTPEAYSKYEAQLGTKIVDGFDLVKEGIVPKQDEVIGYTKITTGEYITPKGRMIDKKGLIPDIAVEDYKLVNDTDVNNIEKLEKTVKPVLNDEGIDIYNAEKILKLSGYDVDAPDTKLDDKTFKAIAKFQKDQGKFSYGKLDFATQQALNDKLDQLKLNIDLQYSKAMELLKN